MRGTCRTCEHYSALHGECHEDSPKAFIVGMQPPRAPGHPPTPITVGAWPPVQENFSCGKYKADVNPPALPDKAPRERHVFSHVADAEAANGHA